MSTRTISKRGRFVVNDAGRVHVAAVLPERTGEGLHIPYLRKRPCAAALGSTAYAVGHWLGAGSQHVPR